MSRSPVVVVHRDKQLLADAAAARLVTAIVDAQASRGEADVVLTGGSMGSAILESLGASAVRDAVDWSRVNVWWGDERFLPSGDPERNETQARAALLDEVGLDPARVHAVPGPDSPHGASPEASAAWYAAQLADHAARGEDVPRFDVVMLGVGPDAHVASLFPEHPVLHEEDRAVVGVHGSPKPPPMRVSLTFRALCSARDVWFLVAGADKAKAVGLALSGAGPMQAPAAGVSGIRSTTWLLDRPAATHVPKALIRISSP
ncbi:MAG TPA: 6-phosphogluconolactonase [Pedococcus sp.]|uniref:6-phosphogluconolactonase n=1 Tax=Pedococcus sp. TaxID=2860345 RepID=UPI002F933FCB